MKNQEFNNSAQKSSALKFPIKKNSMGSMSNQTANLNSNSNQTSKEAPFLLQKERLFNQDQFHMLLVLSEEIISSEIRKEIIHSLLFLNTEQSLQQQQQQMSDLPAINPGSMNTFMNRPFSEDTQNFTNKIEGKKASFNRKNTIQQKLNQQLQQQQQQQQAGTSGQQQQQPQTFPKLRSQIGGGSGTVSNLGDSSTTEKGAEEQERRQKSGYVEKLMLQIKNSQAKQTDITSQNLLMNNDQNSLKINKLQSPAINMIREQCFNSYNQTDSQQKNLNNEDDQEVEEIEQINKDDTYLYSDESSCSPIKSKFQLSSSDASNGNTQINNGKSINLLQQRKEQKSNTNSSEDQGMQNMKEVMKRVDLMGREDLKYQEEKKNQKPDFIVKDQLNEQSIHSKSIRERLSLPEKNKDILPPPQIKERLSLTKENTSSSASNSNANNQSADNDISKGAGSFGQVFTAMNCNTGEIFVVKKIMVHGQSKLDKEFLDEQEKELRIMQTLSHEHIIQYKGHERQQDCLCIFLEYMSEGNIDQMLKKFGALEEQTIKVYARQILSGISYLHSQKVIHKDIKGANILVGSDGIVKLSDFGCAKQLELTLNSNKEMNKTLKGSVPWMSPEIVTQTKYDTKADIWSFGCTILEMAQAEAPWSNYQFDNPIAAIMKIGLSDEIPKIPDNISPELNEFIRKSLQRDPSKRPTAIELLNDPFLAEIN